MKKSFGFLVAIAALVLCSSAFVWKSQVEAAQPVRVYGLYDANNAFIGDVVGVGTELVDGLETTWYTTYLPSTGTMQKLYLKNGVFELTNKVEYLTYVSTDCTGTGYVEYSQMFVTPWVVTFDNQEYKLSPNLSTLMDVNSRSEGGVCEIMGDTFPFQGYATAPANLPYSINSLVPPLSLR